MRQLYITCLFLIVTYVGAAQTADFEVKYNNATHCTPVKCDFEDKSSGGVVDILKWYKDGAYFADSPNPGVNFIQAGTYKIRLDVTFKDGPPKSIEKSVVIHPIPEAKFELQNPADSASCAPIEVTFIDKSTTATGTITKYEWNLGMPLTGNETNPSPTHTYPTASFNPGYKTTLVVTNNWGCRTPNLATRYIKVYLQVEAKFNVEWLACSPAAFKFTNQTTGGQDLTYEWDMGNGTIITTTDIASHVFTDGAHTITLTAKNKSNCIGTYSKTIIAGNPKGIIKAPIADECVNKGVSFSSDGSTNVSSYEWIIKDKNGQIVTTNFSPYFNYPFNTAGEYDIILITKNNNGKCIDTTQKKITIKPGPKADFTVTKIENCEVPFNVQITNNTVGTNLTYDWTFGDGATSQSPNPPIHQYDNIANNISGYSNSYTIKLVVTDPAANCSSNISKTVSVQILKIDTIPTSYAECPPATIEVDAVVKNFINSDGVKQYSWNFGDPAPLGVWENTNTNKQKHTYKKAGTYFIKLKVLTNKGCQGQNQIKKVVIAPGPCDDDGSGGGGGGSGGFIFTKLKICDEKYNITFNDTVANTKVIEWDFEGTPPVNTGVLNPIVHLFTPPKKRFKVKVIRINNTTGDTTVTEKNIIIIDEKANFTTDIINLCKGKTATFTTIGIDSSKIKTYTWDFGDSTAVEIIQNDLTLTGPYNNGNTSHTYFKNGVFDVTLIIEDKLGCFDTTVFKSIIVKGPVAGINANPLKICGDSLAVTFNDSSYQNGTTSIKKWIWDFGDNTPINNATTNASINHTYYNSTFYSEYTALLTIEDSIGCTSTAEKVIKLYDSEAKFYSNNVFMCNQYKITLYGHQTNAKEPALYIWDYGDGSKLDTLNSKYNYPTHTYLKDSLYTVKLKVVDENNCVASLEMPDYIKIIKPKADFSFDANDTCICAPVPVMFRSKSKYAIKQQWYINGKDAGTDTLAPYQFMAGHHTVKLVVVGPDSCVHDTTQTIHIKGPVAKVDVIDTQGCAPFKVKLSVTGSGIETYVWDFKENGNTKTTDVPFVEYTYTKPGKYLPTVILYSPETCLNSKIKCDLTLPFPEIIVDVLKSDFVIDPFPFKHCDTANIQFTSTSVVPNFSSVVSTTWLFGDGTTASGNPIPSHMYSSPGTYYIKMIDSSKYGCKDTAIKSITIGESPKIEITGDSIICLTPLSKLNYKPLIKNLKTSLDTIATYQWGLDGKIVSTDSVLELNYRVPGVHEIQLLATTVNTCSAIAIKKIVIDSIKAQFTSDTSLFCGKGIVAFTNLSASALPLEKYNWNFGNGITFNGKDTSITYNQPGNYTVNLFATSKYGCRDTISDTVKIFKKPLLSIKDTSLACKPSFQLFKSTVAAPHDSIVTYNWSVNGLVVGNKDSLNKFFNAGNYKISLNIKTDKGCVDTLKRNIRVDSLITNFDVLTPNLCGPSDTAKFKNQSVAWSGIKSYLWNYGDNTTSTTKDSIHIYTNPPKSYDVSLIINSVFGCADTIYKKAIIHHDKSLAVAINGVKETCVKNTLLFKAIKNLVDSIKTYQWVINNDSLSTKESLSHYFSIAGNYQVKLYATSIHNCKGDTTISVTIHPLPKPAVTNDTVICVDESVKLLAHDGIKYSWLPIIGLTDASIANPIATPIKNTEYIVTVTNQFSCEAKDTVNIKVDKRVEITAKEVAAICSGESVQLNAYGNTNKFKWIPDSDLNDANIANPIASPTKPVIYNVIGYSANNCPDDTAKVRVRVNELPKIDLTADTTIIIGVPIQLNAIVNNLVPLSYLWTPSNFLSCVKCPNPLFTGSENSIYFITVKSEEGCIATDTINVHLFCEDGIFVPNAFTPNDDGLNDVFYPQSKGYGLVQSLLIFNRWGDLVFEQKQFPLNDPTYGWDGTFKGNKIQGSQVFVYTMKVKCLSGKSYSYTGKVTIVQ